MIPTEVLTPTMAPLFIEKPVIYLEGPVIGHWHEYAIDYFLEQEADIMVASPHILFRPVTHLLHSEYDLDDMALSFGTKREWELYIKKEAAAHGAILHWIPKKEKEADSYELKKVLSLEIMRETTNRICVGTDGNYQCLKELLDQNPLEDSSIRIHKTIEETCEEALRIALHC